MLIVYRPVGSGKTALMLALSKALRDEYNIAAVTNDIFTRYVYRINPCSKRTDLTSKQRRRRIPNPEQSPAPLAHPRHRNRRLPARRRPRGHQRQPARPAIAAQAIPDRLPPHRVRRRQPGRELLARAGGFHHLRDRRCWRRQGAAQGRPRHHGV